MDDNDFQNTRYSVSLASSNLSDLYTTARISPISITYFHYCLENGDYTVSLHFAEIQFTNDQTYTSLGRRVFDIYVQEEVLRRDFNIEDEAKMAEKPVILDHNVSVTNNILEIRFYFAGKGTTRIPDRGVYGPLISAISVKSGRENHLKLDWPTRRNICIGIARGLAFLHEESVLKIVHRDIKATNVLLDRDLNPKISDFGLAKLDEDEKTHMSTRVAGTIGYMAPEYALWGHLTYKADVYSFGVVALEIISGKNNNNYIPSDDWVCLLDWACHLQQTGNLLELVDEKLGSEVDQKEAEIMVKVALISTNASASLRPSMYEVVSMLEGQIPVPDVIPESSTYREDLRFKAMRDLHWQRQDHSLSISRSQHSTTVHTFESTSTSSLEFSEINPNSTSS
ncbi:hypothetical protein CerSpe_142680 [Prunus speciosa]